MLDVATVWKFTQRALSNLVLRPSTHTVSTNLDPPHATHQKIDAAHVESLGMRLCSRRNEAEIHDYEVSLEIFTLKVSSNCQCFDYNAVVFFRAHHVTSGWN